MSSQQQGLTPAQRSGRVGLKSWRLVVRNLPFDCAEQELRTSGNEHGRLIEVVLPKCRDPKYPNSCAGFCFLQYRTRREAEAAKQAMNFSELRGRKLAVDWAVDKDSYVSKEQEGKDPLAVLKMLAKRERSNEKTALSQLKGKKTAHALREVEDDEKDGGEGEEGKLLRLSTSSSNRADGLRNKNRNEEDRQTAKKEKRRQRRLAMAAQNEETSPRDNEAAESQLAQPGSDPSAALGSHKSSGNARDKAVAEGRVLFLRNVDYEADNEDLQEVAAQFGEVTLAVLCKAKRGRSGGDGDQQLGTGTAFVHFAEKSGAEAMLQQIESPEGLLLNLRQLYGHLAVSKEEAKEKFGRKPKAFDEKGKDRRNLYLLHESKVRHAGKDGVRKSGGEKEEITMSKEDAELRQRLASAAKTKLKNPLMFVSPTRLSIHNIPFTYRDEELRSLCLSMATNKKAKAEGKQPAIHECRIMRRVKGSDARGRPLFGKSMGFGFVEFATHEDALCCLRKLNNDAEVFGKARRPIVEFAVENRRALQIKAKRQTRQKQGSESDMVPDE